MARIINVDYGVSSVYSNGDIEINKKIKGKLRKKILAHEKRHKPNGYSLEDYKNDFRAKEPHFWEVLLFSLKNREALINYFLVMYSYYLKAFTINYTAIFPIFYFGLIFTLFYRILFKVSLLNGFIGFLVIYVLINIILLIYTHYKVKKHYSNQ